MLMERTFEVVRGWPNDGAIDRPEFIKAGSTLVNGDVVAKQSDGSIDKVGGTAVANVGFVFAGNGDSASCANSGKATVLWGNFVAKTSNFAAGAYVPGSPLKAVNGQLALGVAGTDPIVGYVQEVVAASGTETAHLTFIVR